MSFEMSIFFVFFFFFQAEDGIRDGTVTGVQTCALPIFFRRQPRSLSHWLSCCVPANRPVPPCPNCVPKTRMLRPAITIDDRADRFGSRSEEHTSELQSQFHLVCRLLLEKKKKNTIHIET